MYVDDRDIIALENDSSTTQEPVRAPVAVEDIKDVVVVGSGPAGALSSLVYVSVQVFPHLLSKD